MGVSPKMNSQKNNGVLSSGFEPRDNSLIPLRQIYPHSGEIDQIYVDQSPDTPLKDLDIEKCEAISAFLRVTYSLLCFGNEDTRKYTVNYFRQPENLMLLSICCMGTRSNPMYFRSSIGAKFFAICAEICSSTKFPWYSSSVENNNGELETLESRNEKESKTMIKIFDIVCKSASRALCTIRQRLHEYRRTSQGDESLALFASKCLFIISSQIEHMSIDSLRKSLHALSIKHPNQIPYHDLQNVMWKSLIPLSLVSSIVAFIMFDMDKCRNDILWFNSEKKISSSLVQNFKEISSIMDLTREYLLSFCASCVRTCSEYRYQILEEFVRSDVIDRFPVRPAFVREMLALVAKETYTENATRYLLRSGVVVSKESENALFKLAPPSLTTSFFAWCIAERLKPMLKDKPIAMKNENDALKITKIQNDTSQVLLCEWIEAYSSLSGYLGQRLLIMTSENYYFFKRYYEPTYPQLETNPRNFGVAFDNQELFEQELRKDGYIQQIWKYDYKSPRIERVCIGSGQSERIHILLQHQPSDNKNGIELMTLLTKGRRASEKIAGLFFTILNRGDWGIETDTVLMHSALSRLLSVTNTTGSKRKGVDIHMISEVLVCSSASPRDFIRQTMVITDTEFLLLNIDYNQWNFELLDEIKEGGEYPSSGTGSSLLSLSNRFELKDLTKITFEGFDLPSVVVCFDSKIIKNITSPILAPMSAPISAPIEYTIFFQGDLAREQMRRIILIYGRGLMRRY